jgi:transposase
MIPSGVQIFVALEPIDMRLSFDRLAGIALERTGYDVRGGSLFLFFGKRGDALKILFADPSGMCLFYKRLDHGTYGVPVAYEVGARHVEIDDATLDTLLDGVQIEAKKTRSKKPRVH